MDLGLPRRHRARLLLMRRVPRPPPDGRELWRFRVLGAIIPEFDGLVAASACQRPDSDRSARAIDSRIVVWLK